MLIAICYDFLAIPLAWLLAYWTRFNLDTIPSALLNYALKLLPLLLIIQGISFLIFGLYRGVWRFASIPDLSRIIKAVLVGSASMFIVVNILNWQTQLPRSIIPLYALILISILGGARFLYRLAKNNFQSFTDATRVLIIGAGGAGESLIRDMLNASSREYLPIAFIDDDDRKLGQEIHGIRVVGNTDNLEKIITKYNIELIFIALPSATSAVMRRIVALCEKTALPFRTLPGLKNLASGKVSINLLRDVSIEDLLGREPVSLDWHGINNNFNGKTIVVSGGGGSIGSELCRQIASVNPATLIVIDNSEYNLYLLDMELRQKFPSLNFHVRLVDICDQTAVRNILQSYYPDIIFHAAAYKHVPLLEMQLRAAVKNNILGTWNLAKEAIAHEVKQFIIVSTDKAVNPTNVMGASKRAAEIICQNYNEKSNTQFITVRFGNVMGSAGSVIPLFQKQIKEGGPITVTHPEITRFFMTIPEAAQLIIQATIIGKGGEIFILEMGESIKIKYLAEQMIQLAGLKIEEDIQITYTGLRPGEKLHEELFHKNEHLVNTNHAKILQATSRLLDWAYLTNIIDELEIACEANNENHLNQLLAQLVPEWNNEIYSKKLAISNNTSKNMPRQSVVLTAKTLQINAPDPAQP